MRSANFVVLMTVLALLCQLPHRHTTTANEPSGISTGSNPLRHGQSLGKESTPQSASAGYDAKELMQLQADLNGNDAGRGIVAIYRLQDFGAVGAEMLVQTLVVKGGNLEWQFPVLSALEKIGEPAVPALVRLIDPKPEVERYFVWQALHRLGAQSKSAMPTMKKILLDADRNPSERASAASMFAHWGPESKETVDLLLSLADDEVQPDEVRLECVRSASKLGTLPSKQVAALTTLMLKENVELELRVAAATALVNQPYHPPVLLPTLIGLLEETIESGDPTVIMEQLGQLGPQACDGAPTLCKLLDHQYLEVRLTAIATLAKIGPSAQESKSHLDRLMKRDEAFGVAEAAAQALLKIDPGYIHALVADLDADEGTRNQVLKSLVAIGPAAAPAVPKLVEFLRDPELVNYQFGIARILKNIGPGAQESLDSLTQLLTNPEAETETRAEAALAIAAITAQPQAALISALKDPNPEVRIAAAEALAVQNARERIAIPALLELLSSSVTADSVSQVLSRIGPDAIPALEKIILDRDADLELRRNACFALSGIRPDSIPVLIRALQNEQAEVREMAASALGSGSSQHVVPALVAEVNRLERVEKKSAQSDPSIVLMLELIEELSGGRGGPAGGAAPPASLFPEASASPGAAASPDMAADSHSYRTEMPAEESPTAEPSDKLDLKVVKVFYGTNRAAHSNLNMAIATGRRLLPALTAGMVTILVCGIGFARSRSPRLALLTVMGMIATLCLMLLAPSAPAEPSESPTARPGPIYTATSTDQLMLGVCEVTIPATHDPGEMESPSIFRLEFEADPQKHIVLRECKSYDREEFHSTLKEHLNLKGNNLLVFVHGYNVNFDDAARRTAQLAVDLQFQGVPVLFSWPSQGHWYQYRKDEKQVELSVPVLKNFLIDIAKSSGADSIHLVAHSMGNRALTNALKEIELSAESDAQQFNQVVLAAPDIDADVFRQRIAPAIVSKAKRVTLYASSNDLALMASRTFNSGDLRAGDTSRGLVLTPGIETIDVSAVDTSLLGHSYYGDSPTVLTDLRELIASALSADERPNLRPMAVNQARYWIFNDPRIAAMSDSTKR